MALATIALMVAAPMLTIANGGDRSDAVRRAIDGGQARNVILLIGDGLDDSSITIARNYTVGAAGKLALDKLQLTGQMTTYSVTEADPSVPDYTPESASTATAWSTGRKTADGRISTSAATDRDLRTTIDRAERAGMRTGVVTTSEVSDATPGAPMAHVANRSCQGPADMAACPQDRRAAGGPGSIAEQSVDHRVDVILGGGRARYEQINDGGPYAGRSVLQQADALGYQVISSAAELSTTQPGTKVLGLFNAGNMSVDWTGLPATNPASGPQRCLEDQRPANEPSLAEMTETAIDLLSGDRPPRPFSDRQQQGFFLQVESASVDKRAHASQPCEQIGEAVNLDEAVRAALRFARSDGNTLVIVTGDHAHTPLIVDLDQVSPGFSSVLTTDEGAQMQVTYGTGTTPVSQGHTGGQIRVAARGPQAANVVGLIDQTDIARIIRRALDL